MAHTVVKPEVIVKAAAEALESKLVVPAVFQREGIDKYRGAKDDTINVTVEGVLPYHTYGWRNDRSSGIVFDEYAERKFAMQFGDDIYSGVKLTDEQNEMDLHGWAKLAGKQTDAIRVGLEYKATQAVLNAPYEVVVTLDEADLRGGLIQLRKVMNKLKAPGARSILVDDDLETALLSDKDLNLASNVGEGEAVSALREATLGRRYGFDFVKAEELPSGTSVAMVDGGFIFLTAAPSVPQSVPFGATASVNGVALRWIRDYDTEHFQDRSVFNAYQGFQHVKDPLRYVDGTGQAKVSTTEHFVRAVKVELGAAFDMELGNSEIATITGLTSTDGINDGA